jgi:hypothetical protein
MSGLVLFGFVVCGLAAAGMLWALTCMLARDAWLWMAQTWHEAAAEHNPDTRDFVAVRGIVEGYIRRAHVEPVGDDAGRSMGELAQVLGFLDEKGQAR